ncbi:hypothetical protein E4U23_003410 [Claviceps purpurea]|nr:hypothetical protein E4U37_000197 [Claviceps purpurea]KAG6181210.1 hypothetical protein E4U27_002444 [Claviceps purpurea]KAG6247942.1 hypothetical protein E4U23_003410 [Claviceps purpurea]
MSETRVSREAEVLSPVVPFRDEAAYFNLPKNAFMKPPLLLFNPPTPSVSENRNFEALSLSRRVPHDRAPPGSLNFNSLLVSQPASRSSISLRSASTLFSVDPPRPPREGHEWVWFAEGYWAERQPIPRRKAKSGTRSRFWKWKPRYCRKSTSDAQYQASPTVLEAIPFSDFGIVRATKASPYLSESAHVLSLQNPEGSVDLQGAGERDSVLPNPQERKSRPRTTSTERKLSVQRPKSCPRARYVRTRANGSKYSIFSALNERLVIPPCISPRNRSEQGQAIEADTGLLSADVVSGVRKSEEVDAGSLPVKTIPRRSCWSDGFQISASRVNSQLKRSKAIRKLLMRPRSQYWSPFRSLCYMQNAGHSPEGTRLTPPNTPHATSEFLA